MNKRRKKKIASLRKKQSISIEIDYERLAKEISDHISNPFRNCEITQSDVIDTEHLKVTKDVIEIK